MEPRERSQDRTLIRTVHGSTMPSPRRAVRGATQARRGALRGAEPDLAVRYGCAQEAIAAPGAGATEHRFPRRTISPNGFLSSEIQSMAA